MFAKKTEHFSRRVRPSRVGIGSGGTAARPGVAGAMAALLLEHGPSLGIGVDDQSRVRRPRPGVDLVIRDEGNCLDRFPHHCFAARR